MENEHLVPPQWENLAPIHPELAKIEHSYNQLIAGVEANEISFDDAVSTLAGLTVTDGHGLEWGIDTDGKFFRRTPGGQPEVVNPVYFAPPQLPAVGSDERGPVLALAIEPPSLGPDGGVAGTSSDHGDGRPPWAGVVPHGLGGGAGPGQAAQAAGQRTQWSQPDISRPRSLHSASSRGGKIMAVLGAVGLRDKLAERGARDLVRPAVVVGSIVALVVVVLAAVGNGGSAVVGPATTPPGRSVPSTSAGAPTGTTGTGSPARPTTASTTGGNAAGAPAGPGASSHDQVPPATRVAAVIKDLTSGHKSLVASVVHGPVPGYSLTWATDFYYGTHAVQLKMMALGPARWSGGRALSTFVLRSTSTGRVYASTTVLWARSATAWDLSALPALRDPLAPARVLPVG